MDWHVYRNDFYGIWESFKRVDGFDCYTKVGKEMGIWIKDLCRNNFRPITDEKEHTRKASANT